MEMFFQRYGYDCVRMIEPTSEQVAQYLEDKAAFANSLNVTKSGDSTSGGMVLIVYYVGHGVIGSNLCEIVMSTEPQTPQTNQDEDAPQFDSIKASNPFPLEKLLRLYSAQNTQCYTIGIFDCGRELQPDDDSWSDKPAVSEDQNLVLVFGCAPGKGIKEPSKIS